ncbi:hypothetical protein MCEMSE15_01621 [Fimbriimonadaceae bacterium]
MVPSSLPAQISHSLVSVPGVGQIAVSRSGRFIATADTSLAIHLEFDGNRLWSSGLRSESCLLRPIDRIRGLAFSDDDALLVAAINDSVVAFSVASAKPVWSYTPPRSFGFLVVSPLSVSAGEGRIAASFDNGSVVQWTSDGRIAVIWHANDAPRQLKIARDEIVGTDSFSLTRWSMHAKVRRARIRMPERIYGFDASESHPYAVTRSLHYAHVWNLETGKAEAKVEVGTGLPLVQCHPTEAAFVIADRDQVVAHRYSGEEIARFDLFGERPLTMKFTPDGAQLLVGSAGSKLLRLPWSPAVG